MSSSYFTFDPKKTKIKEVKAKMMYIKALWERKKRYSGIKIRCICSHLKLRCKSSNFFYFDLNEMAKPPHLAILSFSTVFEVTFLCVML